MINNFLIVSLSVFFFIGISTCRTTITFNGDNISSGSCGEISPSLSALPSSVRVTKRGSLSVNLCSFLNTDDTKSTLYISQFGVSPTFQGSVTFANITEDFPQNANPQVVIPDVVWPNNVVPAKTNAGRGVAVAGGFLVPGKSTGAITIALTGGMFAGKPWAVSTKKLGFFYHNIVWKDVNNDGLMDIVTTRSNKPIIGQPTPEWIWLEQPRFVAYGKTWTEHVIAQEGSSFVAPDFFFDFSTDGKLAVAATYFSSKVVLYTGSQLLNSSSTPISSIVLDDTIGHGYAADFIDIDGDGTEEIVVTNHNNCNETNGGTSGAYIYARKPGTDPTEKSNWIRSTLVSGFATFLKGSHQASLGQLWPFYPNANSAPWFVLPGDGNSSVYILFPTGPMSFGNYPYAIALIESFPSVTVGQPVIITGKFGANNTDIFVPAYEVGQIHRYTLSFA